MQCLSDDQAFGRGVCGGLCLQGGPDAWSHLFITLVCRIEQDGHCVQCGEGLVCPVGSTLENLKKNTNAEAWRVDVFTRSCTSRVRFSLDSLLFLRY